MLVVSLVAILHSSNYMDSNIIRRASENCDYIALPFHYPAVSKQACGTKGGDALYQGYEGECMG